MDRTALSVPPVVLIAARQEHSLGTVLEGERYEVYQVHSASLALECAPSLRPDAILLDAGLTDMSAIDACRQLHDDLRVGHSVPIVLLAPERPSPEQRVAALRAGAWDFVTHSGGPEELSLMLQTYVQAKRNIDLALAEGVVDPTTGVHNRSQLARRARELGALMARQHGALACVVFALETDALDPRVGTLVAQAARVSDVVGVLGPGDFAVLAPATDEAGAVKLAQRVSGVVRQELGRLGRLAAASALRVGYEAVGNLRYTPIDPVELLQRATAAVRSGRPESDAPWVRRFDLGSATRPAPSSELAIDHGRTDP